MSSFYCEHCGTYIVDTDNGYVTECVHYPLHEYKPMTLIEYLIELSNQPDEEK